MVQTRQVSYRIPVRVHRRIELIAEEQGTTLTVVIVTALTELADRFKAGEEIALVRR